MLELRAQYSGLLEQLIDIFAETTPATLGELERAHDAGDADAIRRTAHGLKGASQNVGATAMADLCRSLETDPAVASTALAGLRDAFEQTLEALRGLSA